MQPILRSTSMLNFLVESRIPRWWCSWICLLVLMNLDQVKSEQLQMVSHTAHVNITYRDPVTGQMRSQKEENARYGLYSRLDPEHGIVVHVKTGDNQTHGCSPPVNVPSVRWIALVERGYCDFHKKIYNSAVLRNASAVVIYDNRDEHDLINMMQKVDDVVSIFIKRADGEKIARLVDNGTKVMMRITVGRQMPGFSRINKTSVLFVSISIILVAIPVCGICLLVYYIRRFRYAHTKERLSSDATHRSGVYKQAAEDEEEEEATSAPSVYSTH